MTRPKLTKGPDRYTIQQLRKKAEEFFETQDEKLISILSSEKEMIGACLANFLEYLEAQK